MNRPVSRALISLLTALVALGPVSISLYVPSMPSLASEFRAEARLVQQTFTIFLAGFAAAQLVYWPVLARLEETIPRRDAAATDPARLIRNYAGRLEGRPSTRRTANAGLAAAGLAAALMLLFAGELSLARVIGPMMLFVFGFGLLMPACTAAAPQPFPRIAGSASAMMGFLQMGVGAVGSLVLSQVYDGAAMSLGLVMAVLAALGAAGFLLLAPGAGAEGVAAREG